MATKKLIRTITVNPTMEEDIQKGCAFHGWTFSRWIEEAMKFQILADRKAIKAAEAKNLDPTKLDLSSLDEETFNQLAKKMGAEASRRMTERIVKTEWVGK